MIRQDDSPTSINATWLLVALAVLGWLWVQDLPRSFREAEAPLHPAVRQLPEGVVDARLWQDPFSAVSDHWADSGAVISYGPTGSGPGEEDGSGNDGSGNDDSGDEGSADDGSDREAAPSAAPRRQPRLRVEQPEIYRFIQETRQQDRRRPLRVLVGLLRGTSGAEEAERRRRQRHAVVSALARRDFHPVHGSSLGWLHFRDEQRSWNLPLFFELFTRVRDDALPEDTILLWVNEEQIWTFGFGRDPMAVISEIVATFLDPILPTTATLRQDGEDRIRPIPARERLDTVSIMMLGPSSSDSLNHLLTSAERTDCPRHYFGKLSRASQQVLGWDLWEGDTPPGGEPCPPRLAPELGGIQELFCPVLPPGGGDLCPRGPWRPAPSPWPRLGSLDPELLPPRTASTEEPWTDPTAPIPVPRVEALVERFAEARRQAVQVAIRQSRPMGPDLRSTFETRLVERIDRDLLRWLDLPPGEGRDGAIQASFDPSLCRDLRQGTERERRVRRRCIQNLVERTPTALQGALPELSPTELASLGTLLEMARRRAEEVESELDDTVAHQVIHRWLLEWTSQKNALKREIRASIEIYSGRATSPLGTEVSPLAQRLYRTVATDDHLIDGLLQELESRGLDLTLGSGHHLVLVSEWDTSYGRALPDEFASQLQDSLTLPRLETAGLQVEGPPALDPCLRRHRYSYLRGLDGMIPSHQDGEGRPRASATPAQNPITATLSNGIDPIAATAAPPVPLQRPSSHSAFGRSQIDHAQRIGENLTALDQELRRRGCGQVRAIGILGSDFHDKQLILQVLRKRFPKVVFFTTDLDARYYDRDKQRWNRNLLVSSSFGLEMALHLQGDIPPFRDSYSTATYLAALQALGRDCPCEGPACDLVRVGSPLHGAGTIPPRIYEISRTGAEELFQPAGRMRSSDRDGIHPLPPTRRSLPGWLVLLTAGIPLLTLTLVRQGAAHAQGSLWRWKAPALVTIGFIPLVLLLAWKGAGQLYALGGEEPVLWLSGVSIWPTQILRLLVICLAVYLFFDSRYRLRQDEASAAKLLVPPARWTGPLPELEAPSPRDAPRTERPSQFGPLASLDRLFYRAPFEAARSPLEAWSTYQELGQGGRRWARTLLSLVPLALVGVVLGTLLGDPGAPARGGWSILVDSLLRPLSLLAVTLVLLWQLDATLLCWNFVKTLGVTLRHWEPERLPDLEERWGLAPRFLQGAAQVEIVARLTSSLWPRLGGPMVLLALLVVARSRFFDAWSWPPMTVIGFLALLLVALTSAFLLRTAAQASRRAALRSTAQTLSRTLGAETGPRPAAAEAPVPPSPAGPPPSPDRRLELVAEVIAEERRGALGGWWASPLLRTAMIITVLAILLLLDLTYA